MQLLNVQTVPAQITNFNLDKIVAYAIKKNPDLVQQNVESLKQEYINYMFLASVSDKTLAVPSKVVDDIWHAHLLHNKSYEEFCALLGKMIYHNPTSDETTPEQKAQTMQNLIDSSYQFFGGNVFESIVSFTESDCNYPVNCSSSCDGSSDDGD